MKINQGNVCLSYREKVLDQLGVCSIPLPKGAEPMVMQKQFCGAPQFEKIVIGDALRTVKGKLRVLLVGDDIYSMEQCAMYLTSMCEAVNQSEEMWDDDDEDDRWGGLDDDEDEEEEGEGTDCIISMPSMLFAPPVPSNPMEAAAQSQNGVPKVCSKALLVKMGKNEVASKRVFDRMIDTYEDEERPHLFLALKSNQIDRNLANSIQLRHGFVVCKVGKPTQEYLKEVFLTEAERYYPSIRSNKKVKALEVVEHLQQLQGSSFNQRDIEACITRTFADNVAADKITTKKFCFVPTALTEETSGREQLAKMEELEEVKETVAKLVARGNLDKVLLKKGKEVSPTHRHMAFSGAPGTGKTVSARLVAKVLHEEGIGSGIFVQAGREDVVGRYLGHTAPKVAKLFERAQGGVLFIDEVGALITKNSASGDSFADEAINALVLNMENNPETMVIFATYEEEMEQFLNSNSGLRSRVSKTIVFKSYGKKALVKMFEQMVEKAGYDIEKQAVTACGKYLQKRKESNPDTFGNGREVRRVFNAAEEEMAMRLQETKSTVLEITEQDMKKAIAHFDSNQEGEKRLIGFAV